MSHVKVILIHWTPPILFGLFIFYGETPSRFEFVTDQNRAARVTEVTYVQVTYRVTTLDS